MLIKTNSPINCRHVIEYINNNIYLNDNLFYYNSPVYKKYHKLYKKYTHGDYGLYTMPIDIMNKFYNEVRKLVKDANK